jgi:hypothetical protein
VVLVKTLKVEEPMPKTLQPYPEAPQHLSTRSQDIWRTIGPEKAPNPCRRLLLQSALEALDRADQARAAIAEQGLTTTTKTTVKGDQIYLHALKNGAPIWVPLYPEVKFALECVPLPAGAPTDCPYYFWTGAGSWEGHIRMMDRTPPGRVPKERREECRRSPFPPHVGDRNLSEGRDHRGCCKHPW